MDFLDKINYSMIVNSFKQVFERGHREVFCLIQRKRNEIAGGYIMRSTG